MSYKQLPIKIEIIDACDFLVATVARVDDGLASVELHSEVTCGSWPEVSAEIQKALDVMFPEEQRGNDEGKA